MTVNTQKLREAAAGAKEFASVGVVQWPHTAKAHINGLADAVTACCVEINAQSAEIDRLRNMAWTNGDILKESQAEAVKLRAELARLRAVLSQALMALEGYLPSHRNDVTDRAIAVARAALSGESKC